MRDLWHALLASEEEFATALIFSLAGLDASLWLLTQPVFAQLAEILAGA